MEATDGGVLIFDGGLDNFDQVDAFNGGLVYLNNGIKNHAGTVDAAGAGSQISISGGDNQSENADQIHAEHDGVISLASVMLRNDAGATIEATSGGSISWITGGIDNFGTFSAGNNGTITFGGDIGITNEVGGIFQAALGGSIVFGASDTGSVTNDGGTIVATDGGTITFDSTLNAAQNIDNGIIKAGTGGTIIIDGFSTGFGLFNGGGTIEAVGTGAKVELVGATIVGGTIESSSNGVIEAVSGTNTLMNVTIDGGDIKIDPGAILDLTGGSDPNHALTIDGTVTFEGGGTVKLDFTTYKIVAGAGGGTLDNETTIEGAGQIGNGDGLLSLNNEAGGTIDADISGHQFVLDTGNTIINSGTLEATNGATLVIDDGVNNFNTIKADGGAITITLTGNVNSVVDNDGGTIEALDGGQITVNAPGGVLNLAGGTIDADGAGSTISITANVATGTGSGFGNAGLIEALNGGSVSVTANGGGVSNSATIKADGGDITLTAAAALGDGNGITNLAGGLIEALDAGTVTLNSSNVLLNSNGATIKADGGTVVFNINAGLTNVTGGTVEADNGGILKFNHTDNVSNTGVIELNSTSDQTSSTKLVIVEGLNLQGGPGGQTGPGQVTLNDSSNNAIVSDGSAATLTNVDNTISGAGTIGDAHLTLHNEQYGVIDADGVNALILDTGANTITNAGLLEATNGATLEIKSSVANDGGTITASGAGSVVELFGVTVTGGTLESSGNGVIETATASGTSTLSGVTMNDGSILKASDGTFIDLEDTTTINGTVTFEGGGTFVLDAPRKRRRSSLGPTGGTLDIAAGATLTGSGDIGNAGAPDATSLTLNNAGTIDADGNGATLDIDTGNTVTNTGTIEATNGGTLEIDDAVNNAGGTIKALHGGTITFDGGTLDDDRQPTASPAAGSRRRGTAPRSRSTISRSRSTPRFAAAAAPSRRRTAARSSSTAARSTARPRRRYRAASSRR